MSEVQTSAWRPDGRLHIADETNSYGKEMRGDHFEDEREAHDRIGFDVMIRAKKYRDEKSQDEAGRLKICDTRVRI